MRSALREPSPTRRTHVAAAKSGDRELTPPLKWAGGKRWQVPHLLPLWRAHDRRRLVEPFCGGLAVALGLLPNRALLNDANPHLINFYRWLQKGLTRRLEMENDERAVLPPPRAVQRAAAGAVSGRALRAAALFYYLNRTGFNGLCRFNKQGEFNVPFGRYKRIGYTHDFCRLSRRCLPAGTSRPATSQSVPVEPQRFRLRRPALRCRVHRYSQGRLFLGRSGPDGGVAGATPRSRGAGQSVHAGGLRILYRSLGTPLLTFMRRGASAATATDAGEGSAGGSESRVIAATGRRRPCLRAAPARA